MMATDCYGNVVNVGDRVTKVGFCDEYVVSNIKYGGDMVDLSGDNFDISDVNSNDIIKIS